MVPRARTSVRFAAVRFVRSIAAPWRFFYFFVSGLAAIESCVYGLFAIASIVDSATFPMTKEKDLRAITVKRTAPIFNSHAQFNNEPITQTLTHLTDTMKTHPLYKAFDAWEQRRNLLAHRVSPGRLLYFGDERHGDVESHGIHIDQQTTTQRRQWLAQTLTELLTGIEGFTVKYL
jgi:hypothetical protein